MTGPPGNRFIASLSVPDQTLLTPHLKSVTLAHSSEVQEQGERIDYVYFPLSGIISILAIMEDGRAVEAAMIGQDSGVGLAAGLGQVRATSRGMVQASGSALRVSAALFQKTARQSRSLSAHIVVHLEMLLAATQQTAACNSLHDAEQRLARWLLQAQDLVGEGETIPFTQEFLSHMLGVRRTTVTLVAGLLQSARVIQYRRGRIEILDRAALERASCECYSVIHTLAQRSAPVPKNRKP